MSYINPYYSRRDVDVPKEYQDAARRQIEQKLKYPMKHGSSPLAQIVTASSESLVDELKKKKSLLGAFKLRRGDADAGENAPELAPRSTQTENAQTENTAEVESVDVDVEMYDDVRTIRSVATEATAATEATTATGSTASTAATLSTTQSSLFSAISQETSYTNSLTFTHTPVITIQEALPKTFTDLYDPQYMGQQNTLGNGRPMFTKRDLLDWQLNDLRSLLILDSLKPEWNGQIPAIYSPPGFRVQLLPLDSSNEQMIRTLAESDIYKERIRDLRFKYEVAKFIVVSTRKNSQKPMKKYEWRNVIENYLLNLGIEAQCRHDLKKYLKSLKKSRQPSIDAGDRKESKPKGNNLLKRALMNGYTIYSNRSNEESFLQRENGKNGSISKQEIDDAWIKVQEKVYSRVGLDWRPDR